MGGDTLDSHQASAHTDDDDNGEAPSTIEDEMKRVLTFFELLLEKTSANFIFMLGNHDLWPKRMAAGLVPPWMLSLFIDPVKAIIQTNG